MRSKTFKYKDDDYDVVFTVRQASIRDGLLRGASLSLGVTENPKKEGASGKDRLFRVLGVRSYADCLAVTDVESHGTKALSLELTLNEFLELPEAMGDPWLDVVYELNPRWSPFTAAKAEEPLGEVSEPNDKKVSTSD